MNLITRNKTKFDKNEYITPDWLINYNQTGELNKIWKFNIDVASSDLCGIAEITNAKCIRYFSKTFDAMTSKWIGIVWCNPPYGRTKEGYTLKDWVKKASKEFKQDYCRAIVMLIPLSSAKYIHDYFYNGGGFGKIEFVKRIQFVNPETGEVMKGNSQDSMLLIWDKDLYKGQAAFGTTLKKHKAIKDFEQKYGKLLWV